MRKSIGLSLLMVVLMTCLASFGQETQLRVGNNTYNLKAIDGHVYVSLEDVAELLNGDLFFVNGEYVLKKEVLSDRVVYDDGGFYEGSFSGDVYEGYGYRMYADGSYYKGNWKNGLYHGQGILRNSGGDIYDGLFEKGFKMGKGTMYYANNDVYIGDWQYNFREGFGRLTYANKDKYTGYWKDNFYHGPGILFEGRFEKRGEWERGKFKKVLMKSETNFKGL